MFSKIEKLLSNNPQFLKLWFKVVRGKDISYEGLTKKQIGGMKGGAIRTLRQMSDYQLNEYLKRISNGIPKRKERKPLPFTALDLQNVIELRNFLNIYPVFTTEKDIQELEKKKQEKEERKEFYNFASSYPVFTTEKDIQELEKKKQEKEERKAIIEDIETFRKAFHENKEETHILDLQKLNKNTETVYRKFMNKAVKDIFSDIGITERYLVKIEYEGGKENYITVSPKSVHFLLSLLSNPEELTTYSATEEEKNYDRFLKDISLPISITLKPKRYLEKLNEKQIEKRNRKRKLQTESIDDETDIEVIKQKFRELQQLTKEKEVRKRRSGEIWKYLNLTTINLTKYGIISPYDLKHETLAIRNILSDSCFVYCLRVSNMFTNDQIEEVIKMFPTNSVRVVDIEKISDCLRTNFSITCLQFNAEDKKISISARHKVKINEGKYKDTLDLFLIDEHYMINEKISRAYDLYTGEKTKKKYKLVKLLNEIFSDGNFVEITLDMFIHYPLFINEQNGIKKDYTNLEYEKDICCRPLNKNQEKEKEEKTTQKRLYFADFETVTDTEKHEAFMISYCKEDGKIESIFGKDCAVKFLRKLNTNAIVYFHNLKYDFSFIAPHLTDISSVIEKGNKIMQAKGKYENKKLLFKDSLCILPMKLSAFSSCFNLGKDYEKEIFPYEYYNSKTIMISNKGSIEEASKYVIEKDIFLSNIEKIGARVNEKEFNMRKYAQYYCERDVEVLRAGFLSFRKMLLEFANIDCLNFVSISAIAAEYMRIHSYSKNSNLYEFSGKIRDFISRCIYGGRCMLSDNRKQEEKKRPISDFDAVSLYPSAIARLYTLEGIPKVLTNEQLSERYLLEHLFKDDQVKKTKERFISGFFVECEIVNTPKSLHFPLLTKNKLYSEYEEMSLNDNNIRKIYIDHIMFEDLIRFQKCKLKPIRGYYFTDSRDISVRDVIKQLFNKRLEYKKTNNPLQNVIKLILNSVYGKTILKPITKDIEIKNARELDNYILRHYNYISEIVKIPGTELFKVYKYKSINQHFNFCSFGVNILSMSKRIVNEVFAICEDNNIRMFYQDTDSVHLYRDTIPQLSEEYEKKYERVLIGKQLGQFHSDFQEITKGHESWSCLSLFCGKKSYIDVLTDNTGAIAVQCRLKGIPQKVIEITANERYFGNSIPVSFREGLFYPASKGLLEDISIVKLYRDLYEGKKISFNLLLKGPCFEFSKEYTVRNLNSFIREIEF